VSGAPYYDWLPKQAVDIDGLIDELKRRGFPERDATSIKAEADRRTFADLERQIHEFFPADGAEVWRMLDNEPVLEKAQIRAAVVRLCKADRAHLDYLVSVARVDWRDVLSWAQREGLV
jgi:hypothetical protein